MSHTCGLFRETGTGAVQVARNSSRSDDDQPTDARDKARQAEGDERRKATSDEELRDLVPGSL